MRPPSRPAAAPPREDIVTLITLLNQGQLEAAIAHGERLVKRYPAVPNLYNMLGAANIDLKRRDVAIDWFRKGLRVAPNNVETLHNLAVTAMELGRKDEAIAAFERILRVKPDHAEARAQKLLLQAQTCDWQALRAAAGDIARLGIEGGAVPPFAMLPLEDKPARHRIRSERFIAERFRQPSLGDFARPSTEPDRLRIGYFSAEIRDHPVARHMVRTFELHDRAKFEIIVYSYGPAIDDETRTRVSRSASLFRDVSRLNEQQLAELARRDGLHMAIDLTGHTSYSRTGLFAHRAAPVQISYLGYPGTMGAPFIDYVVADRNLIPEDHRGEYSEAPIYLPHVYQAQDDKLPIPGPPPSRASLGLPDTGFVFCGINNSYKIGPALFDIWMRLLGRVEGSVLWLLKSNSWAEENLRKAAAARGIDPARIVFTGLKPYGDYLAQFGAADLFLDSFGYGAGATASNALWAGLPVLTRIGAGYPARMAASLLRTIDLPELITETDEAYEALALALATDPQRLAAIRARLAANRTSTPLFDTPLFVRHLEDGYWQAYRRWLRGEASAVIDVPDLSAA